MGAVIEQAPTFFIQNLLNRMKKKPPRLFICTHDVMRMFGKSKRQAQWLLDKIRKANGKQKGQPVTVREYCRYLNIDPDELSDTL